MWAERNLESMHAHLDHWEAGLRSGVCRPRSLIRAYRDNYGVLINAKDAGLDRLASLAERADDALEHLIVRCSSAMRHARGDVRRATAECAREYQRMRPMVRYGEDDDA